MSKKKVDLSNPVQREAYWTEIASKQFIGRKITAVRYITPKEAHGSGWGTRCIVLVLDDGNSVFPSNDEGNNAGALFTTNKDNPVIPVL